jgi:arylsulfatase A-like enzyme
LILALALFAAPARSAEAADGSEANRPNILFFLVDDQRNDTLGCAGHPILETPTVDRLAGRGVRFTNMFVTTSICAASRASIFTGLFERTHRFTFGTPPITEPHGQTSYPTLLRKHGYRTGFIGKFGVGASADLKAAMFDYFQPHGRNPYLKKQPDGTLRHESEIAGDRAIEFLRSNPAGQPFCLSVSFNAVHAEDGDKRPGIGHYPWPKAVDGMYDDLTVPPPRLSEPEVFQSQPELLKASLNRERFFWRWDTPEKYQTNIRAYFRMISGVDRVIGRVLEQLDRQGIADSTVVVYSADNGYYMGQRGFAGKWSHYEESLRVPLVIHDPRLPDAQGGRVVDAMALNIDLPATFLDLAGADVPRHYQGRSLVPWLRGQRLTDWRDDFFCEHLMEAGTRIPKWEGVRGRRYVYARYFEHDYEFLHDLESDPDQLKNLVDDPACASLLAEMRRRCDELRDRYGGPYVPRPREKKRRKKVAAK